MPTTNEILDRSLKQLKKNGSLLQQMQQNGQLPGVELWIQRLPLKLPAFRIHRFLTYSFSSSILIPVDEFSFTFCAPDSPLPFHESVKPGDIATLYANGVIIGTGIIDHTEISTETEEGERVTVQGRNFLAQLEDQSAVNNLNDPVWGNDWTVDQVCRSMIQNTRMQSKKIIKQDCPSKPYLFATEPGESKISAMQRYCEALNIIFWNAPDGSLVVGRPNMSQEPRGELILMKDSRRSNVHAMTVVRRPTQVPNVIVVCWTGQESVQTRVPKEQVVYNADPEARRLRELGHHVPKCITMSNPQGASPQELANSNEYRAYGSKIMQAYAKREIARSNVNIMGVQAVVAGHYNLKSEPFLADTLYQVVYDRGSVNELMYLYSVDYSLDEGKGQGTRLQLCRLNSIVADVRAK